MAKDDFEVLQYKILKYMYECLKIGKEVKIKDIAYKSELVEIPYLYWLAIIKETINKGYIEGLKYLETKDMNCIVETSKIQITQKGRSYLIENSLMNKAREFLGEPFKIVLGSLVGRL